MPAVAPLAAFLVGLVVVLVLVAAWVFAELLARVFAVVPLIGGWVASHVRALVSVVAWEIASLWDSAAADVGWTFSAVAAWVWEHLYSASRAIGHAVFLAYAAEQHALHALAEIPAAVAAGVAAAVAAAESYAHALALATNAYAHSLALAANHYAEALVGTVERDAHDLFNAAVADVDSLGRFVRADVADLVGRIGTVEAALAGDVSSLVTEITGDLNIAIATAEQAAAAAEHAAISAAGVLSAEAAAGAVGALEQAGHDLVLGPWAALLPVIAPIVGALDPATAGSLGLPGILNEPVPASIPGILSMTLPLVGAIASEVDRCLVRNCGAVNSLGSLFNNLEKLGIAGLLFALVGEAVADPTAAADQLTGALGWADSTAAEVISAVLG